jgi:plastocyanin
VNGAGIRRAALAVTAAAGAAGLAGLAMAAGTPAAVRPLSAKANELAYNVTKLKAPTGRVRLVLTNNSDLAHNIALRGPKLATPRLGKIVGKGRRSVLAFANLPPGRYTFYCSVFGHEAGGMKGTLTVAKRRS